MSLFVTVVGREALRMSCVGVVSSSVRVRRVDLVIANLLCMSYQQRRFRDIAENSATRPSRRPGLNKQDDCATRGPYWVAHRVSC
jgi:hypothetical protein